MIDFLSILPYSLLYLSIVCVMYKKLVSLVWVNSSIFIVGMCCAFVIASFLTSEHTITANIGDSFVDTQVKDSTNITEFFMSWDNNAIFLESLVSLSSWVWKSIRISLLYTDSLKTRISKLITSSYKISTTVSNWSVILLIDLEGQNIMPWDQLFSLSLVDISALDIPIIDSILLFDWDQIDTLSVENRLKNINHY